MKKGDVVFVLEPHGGSLIPYKAKVIKVKDGTVWVNIDFNSSLTSNLLKTAYLNQDFTNWAVQTEWCEVLDET